MGLPLDTFLTWLEDDTFRRRLTDAQGVLSQNVAAALYRSAMEGSVSAQTFYLKHLPPPEWPQPEPATTSIDNELDLTDDEVRERIRALQAALAVPPADT